MNVEEFVSNKKNIIDQNIITYLKGYADGINYWAALNPNKVDQSIFPVSENDLLVGMVFRMPLFYGFDHYIEELIDLLSDEEKIQYKNHGYDSGAVYIFNRLDNQWQESHFIKPDSIEISASFSEGSKFTMSVLISLNSNFRELSVFNLLSFRAFNPLRSLAAVSSEVVAG